MDGESIATSSAGIVPKSAGPDTGIRCGRMNQQDYAALEERIGRVHLKQRLGIETDFEALVFGLGTGFFHLENWYSIHSVIRNSLRLVGLHGRGRRNALRIEVRHNRVALPALPPAFDGFRILQLSDLHVDMNQETVHAQSACVHELEYDLCVLTGDYRAKTFGDHEPALSGMRQLRLHLKDPIYAVLGNHDSIRLVPGFEAMGIRMMLNESVSIERGGERIHLAGIDDAHYYRVDNIEKAARDIPHDQISLLLSHTPEPFMRAAHADFDLMLCGHTHGGQICLPGSIPLIWDADCPRRLAAGPWRYHQLTGYTSRGCGTSIVDVRLNCPPEVTVHTLVRAEV
jgi:predicted MPP superfamily phosphohydrolase